MLRIGLEIHCRLKTATKLFSLASNKSGNRNEHVAPFDVGIPGSLPIVSHEAIKGALDIALALKCTINSPVRFDRKHYKYPDLFNGYQITQKYNPIGVNGLIKTYSNKPFNIPILAVQLEQDTAKSNLVNDLVELDANRAGAPLVEIVTAPSLSSSHEAVQCIKAIQALLIALKVSDATLEDGGCRCDVNISTNSEVVELKNLNSYKDIQDAIEYECQRHQVEPILKETRRWCPINKRTFALRNKESIADYRFLPDADIPAIHVPTSGHTIQPPHEMALEWSDKYQLLFEEALYLLELGHNSYYEELLSQFPGKLIYQWTREYQGYLNPHSTTFLPQLQQQPLHHTISIERMSEFLSAILKDSLSQKKEAFKALCLGTSLVLNDTLDMTALVQRALLEHNDKLTDCKELPKKKQERLLAWIMGQILKKHRVHPKDLKQELLRQLRFTD